MRPLPTRAGTSGHRSVPSCLVSETSSPSSSLDFETVIVGAGVSGLGAGIELRKNGLDSFVLLESQDDLGGTWRDNTYPGVAVDIPSISYCFSFEMDREWSRTYAPGREIHEYLRHCATKYGIDDHILYGCDVRRTEFDETSASWTTHLGDGSSLRSRYVIGATGILSQPKRPDIDGLDAFQGKMMHTADWDHDYALGGKRVAIIGTGASAVQVVPTIAPEVASLEVYQRTPIWIGSKPDFPVEASQRRGFWYTPLGLRIWRFWTEFGFEIGTYLVVNYRKRGRLVKMVEAAQEKYIRKSVADSTLHGKLIPKYGLGCKRPAFSNEYLQSFNRDNVELVTESIDRITERGILTKDGRLHELDLIILGTGFKTLEKGNAPSFEVVGAGGVELGEYWHQNRYQAFNGVSVPGFPNYFMTSSPYSGGFNWFTMLDAHLKYIMRCMMEANRRGANRIEVKREEHDRYFRFMLERAEGTVFKDPACVAANSYYIDRHGDASLALPKTPWWRWFRLRFSPLSVFRFQ